MFNEKQLNIIKNSAIHHKNQGPISVVRNLSSKDGFTSTQISIMDYCAEECKRQRSGEMSVYDMLVAWNYAHEHWNGQEYPPITLRFIEHIGTLVEPIDNAKGFRTIPIGVTDGMGGWIEKAQYVEIPRLLEHLLDSYYEKLLGENRGSIPILGPEYIVTRKAEDHFYYEYENIHPFRDGNGRTGKILYNYLLGTLDNPQMPTNFWGSGNP